MDELMTLDDIAAMYQTTRRHARDVIVKVPGFPEVAPGSNWYKPRWLRDEVLAFLHRKAA